MRGKFVGGMHPSEFLDTFLGGDAFDNGSVPNSPWNDQVKNSFKAVNVGTTKMKGEKLITTPPTESVMGTRLADAIQQCIDTKCFEYVDTHTQCDVNKIPRAPDTGTDGTLYAVSSRDLRGDKPNSTFSECTTEIKRAETAHVFSDNTAQDFELLTQDSIETRGQFTAYAVPPLMFQFRTHFFTVFIRGDTARLIRWDRAGAIVTTAFCYGEEPYLADFYWRFTNATPQARGHDTTVQRLSTSDPIALEAQEALKLKPNEPIYEIKVWNDVSTATEDKNTEKVQTPETADQGRSYYGTDPIVNNAQSATGRATRIFKVWDRQENEIVALKDCWRVDSSSILPEGQVYEQLQKAEVRNIPTCLRAGDVDPSCPYQRTQTQCPPSSTRTLRSHIHYRIVMKEVCRCNITEFKNTKELVRVIRDALIAHTDACEKAGLLHRDVSAGNILITTDGKGLLSDWELSKEVTKLAKARQHERTGTWQFMSAALLQQERPCHSIQDDLESFFHVFSWISLQYTKNHLSPVDLGEHLYDAYDKAVVDASRDLVYGAAAKLDKLKSRALREIGFVDSAFRSLLLDWEDTCAARYDPEPDQDQIAEARKKLEWSHLSPKEQNEILAYMPGCQTQAKRDRLKSGQWFIDRCDEAMKSNNWPSLAEARFVNPIITKDPASNVHVYPPTAPSTRGTKRTSGTSAEQLKSGSSTSDGKPKRRKVNPTVGNAQTTRRTRSSAFGSQMERVEEQADV
ncbi:hypothetical protein K435DRAFT_779564 [Dendrothele bispora CBS 962.96]|uniref:Protein kinase domain-containing protein n=1 Tax=Dendrothele bispora (strain CBS 962.96) TaxID=1314807 RepID=A0A4V4HFA2_DENBC|nr:hypothetical protein K435DRAFT_779564 [Dendrothele bispora CBS 962.96]